MRLTQIIEALLFASDAPLTAADLARVDERLDEDTVQAVIDELRSEYDQTERSFQIADVAGGFQLLTRPEFVSVLERYETVPQPSRLSTPALEVLAIIAYRQPIGRAEVEDIRGVSSSGVLKTLQDRNLVEAVGRSEGMGRPLLYGTTPKFLEHFGFRSLEDLPRPDELPVVLRGRPLPALSENGTAHEPIAEGEPGHVEAPPPVTDAELDHEAELIVEASEQPESPHPLVLEAAAAAPEEEAELAAADVAALAAADVAFEPGDEALPAVLIEEFEAPAGPGDEAAPAGPDDETAPAGPDDETAPAARGQGPVLEAPAAERPND